MADSGISSIDIYLPAILQGCLAARPDLTADPSVDKTKSFLAEVQIIAQQAVAYRNSLQSYSATNPPTS